MFYVVELLRTYSKHLPTVSSTLRHLERHLATDRDESEPDPRPTLGFIHKLDHRFPPEALQQLATDYEAGQSTRQLMQTYGLGKGAVLRVLTDAGVEMRHQGLSDEDQAEAVRLYLQGQSVARVADQLGCSPDHVLACVRRAGHPVRPRVGGRQRKQHQ